MNKGNIEKLLNELTTIINKLSYQEKMYLSDKIHEILRIINSELVVLSGPCDYCIDFNNRYQGRYCVNCGRKI